MMLIITRIIMIGLRSPSRGLKRVQDLHTQHFLRLSCFYLNSQQKLSISISISMPISIDDCPYMESTTNCHQILEHFSTISCSPVCELYIILPIFTFLHTLGLVYTYIIIFFFFKKIYSFLKKFP